MEQRLSLVTLGVADLERARRFYENGLGWRKNNPQAEVAFYQAGGMIVALWSREELAKDAQVDASGSGFRSLSLAYNARSRDEVDAVMAEAKAAGAAIAKVAQETPWGGYAGYFADPDGHLWEVAHNPFWAIDAQGNVTLPKA